MADRFSLRRPTTYGELCCLVLERLARDWKLRLVLHNFDVRRRGLGGSLLLEPPLPATVEDGHVLMPKVLQGPPHTGGFGQQAAVDEQGNRVRCRAGRLSRRRLWRRGSRLPSC